MIKITNKSHILYGNIYKLIGETELHYIVKLDRGDEIRLDKIDCEKMEGYNEWV